jgi:hypothetical protein
MGSYLTSYQQGWTKKQCYIEGTLTQIAPILTVYLSSIFSIFRKDQLGHLRSWVSCIAASCDGVTLMAI